MHKFAPIRYICPKRFNVLVPGLERVAVDHRSRRSVLFASKKNIFSSGSCSPQKKKNISLRPSPVRQSALLTSLNLGSLKYIYLALINFVFQLMNENYYKLKVKVCSGTNHLTQQHLPIAIQNSNVGPRLTVRQIRLKNHLFKSTKNLHLPHL